MAILNTISEWFSKPSLKLNHEFTDLDREKAVSAKRARNETLELEEKLKREELLLEYQLRAEEIRAKIEECKLRREELNSTEEETHGSFEDALMLKLLDKLNPSQNPSIGAMPPTSISTKAPIEVNFTDEQLKAYIDSVPKIARTIARKAPVAELEEQIKQHQPNISKDSLNRAVAMLKAK